MTESDFWQDHPRYKIAAMQGWLSNPSHIGGSNLIEWLNNAARSYDELAKLANSADPASDKAAWLLEASMYMESAADRLCRVEQYDKENPGG